MIKKNNTLYFESTRTTWIDLAKFLGIFAIVFGHTIQNGFMNKYVYSFHVPLFFFLQGTAFSLNTRKSQSPSSYIKHRAFTLLVPYCFFAIISTLFIFIAFKFFNDPQEYIFNSIPHLSLRILLGYCDANRPLWFLPCSFIISVIGYYLDFYLKKYSQQRKKQIFSTVLFICVVFLFLNVYVFKIGSLPYKADILPPMLAYFILGYSVKQCSLTQKIQNCRVLTKAILSFVLIIIGVFLALLNDKVDYLSGNFENALLFLLSSLSSILGWCIFCTIFSKFKALSRLTYIGQNTLSILLMHKFPVLFFQKVIPLTKTKLSELSISFGIIVTIISIAMCCVATIIIELLFPALLGKRKSCSKHKDTKIPC